MVFSLTVNYSSNNWKYESDIFFLNEFICLWKHELIDCMTLMFSTLFCYIALSSSPIYGVCFISAMFIPSHWLLLQITVFKIMVSVERGMNPDAMTIINYKKKVAESGLKPDPYSQVLYSPDWATGYGLESTGIWLLTDIHISQFIT